ncbi:MAG: ferrous iron transport protein A [Actinobacteria bacterium]|nr:ferrous iron transport protein A [Actinomycetota bacterium]MBI3687357.1 ferrous iron transport protein A [Actinomycetota bacterium]
MTLRDCPVGMAARLVGVELDPGRVLRLRELGLALGTVVRVTHRAAFGGRVVAVGPARFAVDAGTARSLRVEVV